MINTFKPYFKLIKRMKNTHDWFSIGFQFNNCIQLNMSIYGYGFRVGVWIFDVLRAVGKNAVDEIGKDDTRSAI